MGLCDFDAPLMRNHYFWGSGAPIGAGGVQSATQSAQEGQLKRSRAAQVASSRKMPCQRRKAAGRVKDLDKLRGEVKKRRSLKLMKSRYIPKLSRQPLNEWAPGKKALVLIRPPIQEGLQTPKRLLTKEEACSAISQSTCVSISTKTS